ACTTNDTCANGGCVSGPALNCDDGNFCTDDSCDPVKGCQYAGHSCDDSNPCTDDSCSSTLVQTTSCVVADNGSGTVTLPPAGCEYLSPSDVHQIIAGLPPGATIELGAIHRD